MDTSSWTYDERMLMVNFDRREPIIEINGVAVMTKTVKGKTLPAVVADQHVKYNSYHHIQAPVGTVCFTMAPDSVEITL